MGVKRILFLGMDGAFSVPPLAALLATDQPWDVVGVVVPRPTADTDPAARLPATGRDAAGAGIVALAQRRNRPVFSVGRLAAAGALLTDLRPDCIVVACFPRLLPVDWLAFPAAGCFNLHPSLLPAYRGPEPLFWQLRAGEQHTGVTLHLLTEQVDAGPLVAQQAIHLPLGAREPVLEQLLATAGGALLQTILRRNRIPHTPQDNTLATQHPFPDAAAREISTTWPVVRAYNFIRGMRRHGPFQILLPGGPLSVVDGLAMAPDPGVAEEPHTRWISFSDGALLVRTARRDAAPGM